MARLQFLDDLLGEHYLAIEAAVNALARPGLDLSRYSIAVAREDEAVFVAFVDKAENATVRANLAVRREGEGKPQVDDGDAVVARLAKLDALDRIEGQNFRAAAVAVGAFLKKFPAKIADYKIEIVGEGESLVAIFADKDQELGTVGHNKQVPGFEVEMRAKDLAVVRANFLR